MRWYISEEEEEDGVDGDGDGARRADAERLAPRLFSSTLTAAPLGAPVRSLCFGLPLQETSLLSPHVTVARAHRLPRAAADCGLERGCGWRCVSAAWPYSAVSQKAGLRPLPFISAASDHRPSSSTTENGQARLSRATQAK